MVYPGFGLGLVDSYEVFVSIFVFFFWECVKDFILPARVWKCAFLIILHECYCYCSSSFYCPMELCKKNKKIIIKLLIHYDLKKAWILLYLWAEAFC